MLAYRPLSDDSDFCGNDAASLATLYHQISDDILAGNALAEAGRYVVYQHIGLFSFKGVGT